MANASLKKLQQGLNKAIQTAAVEPQPVAAAEMSTVQKSRQGKVHLGGWLSRSFTSSLRLVQAKQPEKDLQTLFAEALNDLFSKYNVPTVDK